MMDIAVFDSPPLRKVAQFLVLGLEYPSTCETVHQPIYIGIDSSQGCEINYVYTSDSRGMASKHL